MGSVATHLGAAAVLALSACRSAPTEPATAPEPPGPSPRAADGGLARVSQAIRRYAGDRAGRLPLSLDDLVREGPPEGGHYLGAVPLDPWGRPYSYAVTDSRSGSYDLRSYGPDRLPGTEDDVVGRHVRVPVGTSETP